MLDVECFTYLNRALESPLSPVVVVATNRGVCTIRGTDVLSSHGVPVDLLDRMLIVRTQQYAKEEIRKVSKDIVSKYYFLTYLHAKLTVQRNTGPRGTAAAKDTVVLILTCDC